MATLAVFDAQREKVGECALSDQIFGVAPQEGLLHEVVLWQLAKKRAGTACTKRRSEVRGGGKKPWRQKGTGHARAGSNTSPLWRRGGSVFGPKPRDFGYSQPKKVRRLALRMALSAKLQAGHLVIIRDFGLEGVKTKPMAELLRRFGVQKTVIVTDSEDRVLDLSSRNIPHVKVLPHHGLNVFDLLKYQHLIVKESAVGAIEARLQP